MSLTKLLLSEFSQRIYKVIKERPLIDVVDIDITNNALLVNDKYSSLGLSIVPAKNAV